VKIANVESDVLFPVPFCVIDFDGVENINRAILQEIDRIDWDAEHQRRGLQHLVNSRHQEDVFITTELVPSAKQVIDAFGHSCLEIGRNWTGTLSTTRSACSSFGHTLRHRAK
jgi:hypothetical protein